MTYQKPKIIAKSVPKHSFAAGCPEKCGLGYCSHLNHMCQCGALS